MSARGPHAADLHQRAQAAFDHWEDEQARSEWFEDEAYKFAAIADELQQRVKALDAKVKACRDEIHYLVDGVLDPLDQPD